MKRFLAHPSVFPFLLLVSILAGCTVNSSEFQVHYDEVPQLRFAYKEIKSALEEKAFQVSKGEPKQAGISIAVDPGAEGIRPQGFRLERKEGRVQIVAIDAAGAMYGGLELAEQIRIYGLSGVKETTQNPHMEMRGTKFNIPLDVRTPSYSDMSDAAQHNIPEMWNLDFWEEYIDQMARYRYNFISLWSLHPFPSMVKVPGYEDIALDNVERSKGPFREYYDLNGTGFDDPELLSNTETIKEISIEEKVEFWKKVMAYGKSRNVDFYVVTWNIFTYGTGGQYGINDQIANKTTRDYFKKSVKQMFLTYPDLAGIGLTTGENMRAEDGSRTTSEIKEDWAYEAYATAALEAAEEMPERQFTFIHRQHQTGALKIAEKFKPVFDQENVKFLFSFKYAKAHVYSATRQPYHEKFVEEIKGMETIWTLRNDDIYYFRWGAPDFVREFISNIPHEVSRGYYYGSDQWIWGREFTSRNTAEVRQLEVVKHWYHWMMWGRLGYDPGISNERFVDILQYKFPGTDAGKLFEAWQLASMIYPTTTGFHWGDLDFKWYIEGCKSNAIRSGSPTGFHGVEEFISIPPHVYSGYQSIPDFVRMTTDNDTSSLKTPLQVAELLHDYSDHALELLASLSGKGDRELEQTLQDIKIISLMGKYYAHKIAGSAHVALYRSLKDQGHREKAVQELTLALDSWKLYTAAALEQHINPLWTNRVGIVDWKALTQEVEKDLAIANKEITPSI